MNPVTVYSFSGIYEHEGFHRNREGLRFIDCTDIRGTNGYCDEGAAAKIMSRIAEVTEGTVLLSPDCLTGGQVQLSDGTSDSVPDPLSDKVIPGTSGESSFPLNFIDHGNYHYVSKFTTDRIRTPFHLVVFDHHADMQPAAFGGLLSCGSWVKEVLETNPYVRGVTLIGPEEMSAVIPSEAGDLPLYISLDKDVLSTSEVLTNWDQGTMTADELFTQLDALVQTHTILGMDVCGDASLDMAPEVLGEAIQMNDAFNSRLLSWWDAMPV